jgi:hypothetical protein
MEERPDFYWVKGDGFELDPPRSCWRIRPLRLGSRKDFWLVRVSPPIIYENLDVENLVFASRHKGNSLNSVREWPLYVYVSKLVNPDAALKNELVREDVEIIDWGKLYPTPFVRPVSRLAVIFHRLLGNRAYTGWSPGFLSLSH